ncbi:MAG: peptide chain release factor-like protein, partial [Myxococcota bacterium]|nr:peptide chain release factor-like protein [Myxococcota bacterium]
KVSSAVRVEHVPSGLSVRSSGARSQHTNLDHAIRRLSSLLREQADIRRAAVRSAQRQLHYRVQRGHPVRTYELGPAGGLVERSSS